MSLNFSFIIPVYNRPEEIRELLLSFRGQHYKGEYEIVIVEDGSTRTSKEIVAQFSDLPISYYFKSNSGPGPSRNYGMQMAKGDYYIILDSDCLLPPEYITVVLDELEREYVDFYGGPDAAHTSFSDLQKAINYTMTSVLTTGGIRGNKKSKGRFQPRSFNMGISKEAFITSGGFGKIHPGEDPDLTLRLWKSGYTSRLLSEAYVYHKRRISWKKFYKQVRKFGLVRPILNQWHPNTSKITYWFPTVFILFIVVSLVGLIYSFIVPLLLLLCYLMFIVIDATIKTRSIQIGFMSLWAVLVQFTGYGIAFLESTVFINWLKKVPEKQYPHLFFD